MRRRRESRHAFKGGTFPAGVDDDLDVEIEQVFSRKAGYECECGCLGLDSLQRWGTIETWNRNEAGPSRITIDDLNERDREVSKRTWDQSGCLTCRSTPNSLHCRGDLDTSTSGPLATDSHERPHRGTSRRRKRRYISTVLVSGIALSLLPTSSAAPPIYRRQSPATLTTTSAPTSRSISSTTSSPNPSLTITVTASTSAATAATSNRHSPIDRFQPESDGPIQYLTSASSPSQLPTEIYLVPESTLPWFLAKQSDGSWSKVDHAWNLYGRQPGAKRVTFSDDPDPSATANPLPSGVKAFSADDFSVNENLPRGWGISASRSDFYKVPLIAVASVVLAVIIVIAIIFIVISRRKAHRRLKRRAARTRRKALAAAGLTEKDMDDSAAAAALKEKLFELDNSRSRSGGGGGAGSKKIKQRGPTAMIRTKVRTWNQGLRRRAGRPVPGSEVRAGAGTGASEGDRDAGASNGVGRRSGSGETDRSRDGSGSISIVEGVVPKPGDGSDAADQTRWRRGSDASTRTTPTIRTLPSPGNPGFSSSSVEGGTATAVDSGSGSGSGSGLAPTSSHDTGNAEISDSIPEDLDLATTRDILNTVPPAGAVYFPPAYRPASVRSLAVYEPAPSLGSGSGPGSGSGSGSGPGSGLGAQGTSSHSGTRRPATSPSSSRPIPNSTTPAIAAIATATEKTRAPGYYPAPATEDGEIALAIAARSDGDSKGASRHGLGLAGSADQQGGEAGERPGEDGEPGAEEARRIGHIATDDKRLLERLRMGASAPVPPLPSSPTQAVEGGSEPPMTLGDDVPGASTGGDNHEHVNGFIPSAPGVDIDEEGFERLDLGRVTNDTENGSTSSGPGGVERETRHADIPAPPKRHAIRSLPDHSSVGTAVAPPTPTSNQDPSRRNEKSRELDARLNGEDIEDVEENLAHLLPSAPPGSDSYVYAGSNHQISTSVSRQETMLSSAPSAPPIVPLDDEDEEVDNAHGIGYTQPGSDARFTVNQASSSAFMAPSAPPLLPLDEQDEDLSFVTGGDESHCAHSPLDSPAARTIRSQTSNSHPHVAPDTGLGGEPRHDHLSSAGDSPADVSSTTASTGDDEGVLAESRRASEALARGGVVYLPKYEP